MVSSWFTMSEVQGGLKTVSETIQLAATAGTLDEGILGRGLTGGFSRMPQSKFIIFEGRFFRITLNLSHMYYKFIKVLFLNHYSHCCSFSLITVVH